MCVCVCEEEKIQVREKKRGKRKLQDGKVPHKYWQRAPPNDFLFSSSSPHVLISTL